MKKYTLFKTLFVFMLMLLNTNTHAQESKEKKHQLRVGYGLISTNEILDVASGFFSEIFTGGAYRKEVKSRTGNLNFGYRYNLTPRINAGVSYTHISVDYNVLNHNLKAGNLTHAYHTFALESEFLYLNTKQVKLYGSLGAGVTYFTEEYKNINKEIKKYDNTFFNFQVTPIGIRVGKCAGAFSELGIGYKGIISAGIFASF